MVKKQQKTAGPKKAQGRRKDAAKDVATAPKAADTPFAEQVKASAQQIWSAGLAAFAKAQDQGDAARAVKAAKGAKASKGVKTAKASAASAATPDAAASKLSDMAGEVGSRAGQHWDKLESIFEDRVARALAKLGIPAAEEIARLNARVEALSAEVAMLRAARTGAAAKQAPAKSTKPVKPVKSRGRTT